MTYHDRIKRTYDRAKEDKRFGESVAFKAACLTNMATAAEADAEVAQLRAALGAICGDLPWPDNDMGYVDLARHVLKTAPVLEEPEMPTAGERLIRSAHEAKAEAEVMLNAAKLCLGVASHISECFGPKCTDPACECNTCMMWKSLGTIKSGFAMVGLFDK